MFFFFSYPDNRTEIKEWLTTIGAGPGRALGKAFTDDQSRWPSALDSILDKARKDRFPRRVEMGALAHVHFEAARSDFGESWREEVREKSLLALWYCLQAMEEEAEEKGAVWLEKLVGSLGMEDSARLRGMAAWVRLKLLERKGAEAEIEAFVRELRDAETAPVVWQRIASYLSTWTGTWRLFRDIHSWEGLRSVEPKAGLAVVERGQALEYSLALGIVQGYKDRLPGLVADVAAGKLDPASIDWLFTSHAEQGFGFPLDHDALAALYADPASRIAAIDWLGRYAERAPQGLPDDRCLEIVAEVDLAGEGPLERVASAFGRAELARRRGDQAAALSILVTAATETLADLPLAASGDIHQKVTPRACHLIHQLDSGLSIDIEPILALAGSASVFARAIGVDLLRAASLSGRSLGAAIPVLRAVLEAHPSTKALMGSQGSDLWLAHPANSFVLPNPLAYAEGGVDDADTEPDGDHGGRPSLSTITGLSEVFATANTAYRSATILKDLAESGRDAALLSWLDDFRPVNTAIVDWEKRQERKLSGKDGDGDEGALDYRVIAEGSTKRWKSVKKARKGL